MGLFSKKEALVCFVGNFKRSTDIHSGSVRDGDFIRRILKMDNLNKYEANATFVLPSDWYSGIIDVSTMKELPKFSKLQDAMMQYLTKRVDSKYAQAKNWPAAPIITTIDSLGAILFYFVLK